MAALEKRALTKSEIVTSSWGRGAAGAAESCGEPFKEPGASEDLRDPHSGQGCSAVVGVCSACARPVSSVPQRGRRE